MRETPSSSLRDLIEHGPVLIPSCYDPLSAKVAVSAGFEAVSLGGYALGAHRVISEPLLTLTEIADITRQVRAVVDVPIIVDGGAGFGDATHTRRTVRELESSGASAVHIEDQVFPKRAHYHRGIEHVIELDEMLGKLDAALSARQDDCLIIGRTDALRTHGYAEAVKRARAFLELGCDLVMVFPDDLDQAKRIVQDIGGAVIHTNSSGNRFGRPVLSAAEVKSFGYAMCMDSSTVICSAFSSVLHNLTEMRQTFLSPFQREGGVAIRDRLEEVMGLAELYEIEERTVEGR